MKHKNDLQRIAEEHRSSEVAGIVSEMEAERRSAAPVQQPSQKPARRRTAPDPVPLTPEGRKELERELAAEINLAEKLTPRYFCPGEKTTAEEHQRITLQFKAVKERISYLRDYLQCGFDPNLREPLQAEPTWRPKFQR